jgi:hypothetical protein
MLERYEDLAKEIVTATCEDYIKYSIIRDDILDYEAKKKKRDKRFELSSNDRYKLNKALRHINEDILFFKSGRTELYAKIDGKTILENLERRIPEEKKRIAKEKKEKEKKRLEAAKKKAEKQKVGRPKKEETNDKEEKK